MTTTRFAVLPRIAAMGRSCLAAGAGTTLLLLAGCESIGEGNTVQRLEIVPANGSTETAPYTLYRCLRDQLIVVATFTDGTRADFSFRAKWASDDSDVVQVSNNDVATALLVDGEFQNFPTLPYRAGTVIPRAASGTTKITATFAGLSAALDVTIAEPAFTIAPITDADLADPTSYVGVNLTQRFALLTRQSGRTATTAMLNAAGLLNPIQWSFEGGTADPAEEGVAGDFDKFFVGPDADNPTAWIDAGSGTVHGKAAQAADVQIRAATSLCPADDVAFSAFVPTAAVRVLDLVTPGPGADPDDPADDVYAFELEYESDFNGVGVSNGDIAGGNLHLMRTLANLDLNGTTVQQDVSTQVDYELTHETPCADETVANCVCDDTTPEPVCRKNVLRIFGLVNQLTTLVNDDGGAGTVKACFTNVDAIDADDCEEGAENPADVLYSNALPFRAVPVDFATGTIALTPSGAVEPAFTYPGQPFQAYGTFTPLAGHAFTATGEQKLTRLMLWTTRPGGSTTENSDIAFVRNSSDGFFNDIGRVAYLKDVATQTTVDVHAAPTGAFADVPDPDPVPFHIAPCNAPGCPAGP